MESLRYRVIKSVKDILATIDAPLQILRMSQDKTDGDIDILLHEHDRDYLLSALCKDGTWLIVRCSRFLDTLSLWLVPKSNITECVQLDLMAALPLSKQYYVPASKALQQPRLTHVLSLIFPTAAYTGASIKGEYRQALMSEFSRHGEAIENDLKCLPEALSGKIIAMCKGADNDFSEDDFCATDDGFVQRRHGRALQYLRDLSFGSSVQRVCFLGPDGAGKSTLIDAALPVLKTWSKHVRLIHLKPIVFFPSRHQSRGTVTNPHAGPARNSLTATVKLASYVVEYWIDTIRRVRVRNRTDIFDRHLYDMALDPVRYRLKPTTRMVGFFCAIAPQMDYVFVLTADARVIQRRKQEVSPEETQRAVSAYRQFAKDKANVLHIDSDQTPEQCLIEAITHYGNFVHQRNAATLMKARSMPTTTPLEIRHGNATR